jgi:hypothetical protein
MRSSHALRSYQSWRQRPIFRQENAWGLRYKKEAHFYGLARVLGRGRLLHRLGSKFIAILFWTAPRFNAFYQPTNLSQTPDGPCSVTAERMLSKSAIGPDTLGCRRKELLDPKCRSASGIGCISCSSSGGGEKKVDDGGVVRGGC